MAQITVEASRDLIALTIGLFDAAPGEFYLNEFAVAYNAGTTLSQLANALTTTGAFKTVYPVLDTAQDFAARLIANLLSSETGEADRVWAADWIIGQVNANVLRGDIILAAVQALRTTIAPAFANAKLALENKIAVAEYYSVTRLLSDTDLVDLQAVIADVTSSATTVTAAKARVDLSVGMSLILGTTASGVYSAAGITDLKHGIVAGDVEFTAIVAGTGLTITESPTKNTTYALSNSSGENDSLPLALTGTTEITTGVITAPGIEIIAIQSADSNTPLEDLTHTATFSGNRLKVITVAGNAGLTVIATSTALTSFDASNTNNNATVSFTAGALVAIATLTGGSGDDTLIGTAATKAVVLNGGNGNDTLIADNANNNTVNGGAGNDTIVVGTGSNKVSAGDGADIITVGASAGLITIDVGAGTDTVVLGAPPSGAGFYTSVVGMSAGDRLNFSAVTTNASAAATLGARIALGGASAFSNYLDAATAGDADAAATIKWFYLAGNTYVVVDNGTGADTSNFEAGIDSIIELVGLVDLSAATVSSDIVTLM